MKPTDLITPDQKHVAKMLGYALALTSREGIEAYRALSAILRQRLTSSERQGLAWAALRACDADQAQGIAEDLFDMDEPAIEETAGAPWIGADDVVETAGMWAGCASETELRAYAMACLARLPEADRHAMVAALDGRAAA